jgi:hypothetical protein
MTRFSLTAALAILTAASPVLAHHSYTDYNREKTVVMEGVVRTVLWANPHVVYTIQTAAGEYGVEWWDSFRLAQQGMLGSPLKEGDRITVKAAINKNPERRILTLVREIRRPLDGWTWVDPRPSAAGK